VITAVIRTTWWSQDRLGLKSSGLSVGLKGGGLGVGLKGGGLDACAHNFFVTTVHKEQYRTC